MADKIIEQLKTCAKCGETKRDERFYHDRTKPGGFARRCKDCHEIYAKRRRLPTAERFWLYVEKTETCWNWIKSLDSSGYGSFGFEGRVQKSHRVSYQLEYGAIPTGLNVLHRCDNPPCVRPDHLFLGTIQDNVDDMIQKGRKVICRGVQTGRATLSDDIVRKMRLMHDQGMSAAEIGRWAGVDRNTARKAIIGQSWKHVT